MTIIENYFAGDDLQIEHDVTGVDTTDALIKAWLTIKTSASVLDASATLQKIITVNAVQGTGQITENGSELQGNGTASLVFQLTAADTALLGSSMRYYYDIQVKTATGKIYTTTTGQIQLQRGYTDATT
jgi:hypothetical protein